MNEIIAAASEIQSVCLGQGWKFCFIGGVALQHWGEPRETVDVDLTILTGFGDEDRYVRTLLRHFQSRIPDANRFAIENRVLLLKSKNGVGLDVAFGALPFEEMAVRRSKESEYPPHTPLRICTAEDLLVMKAFAGRAQDWVDVERILVRQTGRLDWEYILEQLRPLAELKGKPEILERLEQLRIECEK